MKLRAAYCLFLLLFTALTTWGQEPKSSILVLSPGDREYMEQNYDLRPYIDVLIDSSGNLGIEDVMSISYDTRFHQDTGQLLTTMGSDLRGGSIEYIWARLSVRSELEDMLQWVVNINAEDVELFMWGPDGKIHHFISGCGLRMSSKYMGDTYGKLACFPLIISPNEVQTFYFRLSGIGYFLDSPFHLAAFSKEHFIRDERKSHAYSLFIYGILLAIASYHFFLFAFQRKLVNLYLGAFILALTILSAGYSGIISEVILPEVTPNFSFIAFAWGLSFLFFYLFSRKYLELDTRRPIVDRTLTVITTVMVIERFTVGLIFLIQGKLVHVNFFVIHSLKAISFILLVVLLILLVRAAFRLKKTGFAPANLYLVGMAVFILSFFNKYLEAFTGFSFLPVEFPADIELIILVIVFSLASARQVKLMEDARIEAESALLAEHAEHRKVKELDAFKSRFFTNISHEFRTPLTVILGMADQIRTQPTTWAQKGSKMIRDNGTRLLNLINQIMDLSKLEAKAMRVTLAHKDVISFARYLAESLGSKAQQKGVQIHFHAHDDLLEMDLDTDKLGKILTNLLDNAIKFTPPGRNIHFSIWKQTSKSDEVIFEIADEGIGIEQQDLDRVFDRYYQADHGKGEDYHGSGVGLSLTKELVRLLGGSISVESTPGKGSIFLVCLPILHDTVQKSHADFTIPPERYEEVPPATNHQAGDKNAKQKVLIVEDSPDVITYITTLLEPTYQVSSVVNGEEGMRIAQKHIPDLIITDIMMPVMDGLEMCAHLKQDMRTNHIPIIVLTAKADLDSRLTGLETGVDAYLAKPFHKKELLARIRNLIRQRDLLQERYRDFNFIFGHLNNRHPEQEHDDQFLEELTHQVREHISEINYNVPELCTSLGMSRSQLYRKFKALTGRSIGEFIRTLRLRRARSLLETTELNISQVALESGFRNLSHFSKAFKKEFGFSPKEITHPHD